MTDGGPDLRKAPADDRPRPLLGVGFWVVIVLGALCVLAGAGVASMGPSLWPAKPAPPAASPAQK